MQGQEAIDAGIRFAGPRVWVLGCTPSHANALANFSEQLNDAIALGYGLHGELVVVGSKIVQMLHKSS